MDGEPVLMAPWASAAGAIRNELGQLLGNHLLATGVPCRIIGASDVVPRVRADENFRIPDLGVTCARVSQPVLSRFQQDIAVLCPDLVHEAQLGLGRK